MPHLVVGGHIYIMYMYMTVRAVTLHLYIMYTPSLYIQTLCDLLIGQRDWCKIS